MNELSNGIFRAILSQLQARRLRQFLDQARAQTGLEGVFCSVSRHYDSASGGTVLELQAARLSPAGIRKIRKIIADEKSVVAKHAHEAASASQ